MLTGHSASAVEWLQDKFNLDLSLVSRLGGHSFPRTHRGKERFPGMTITYGTDVLLVLHAHSPPPYLPSPTPRPPIALMEKLEEYATSMPDRVRILRKSKVVKLLKEGDVVVGVEYEHDGQLGKEYGPVIIATGGYAADFTSDSLLKKYRPELWDLPTTNGDHSTGDGIKFAQQIGSNTVDLEKVQVHPTGMCMMDVKRVGHHVRSRRS